MANQAIPPGPIGKVETSTAVTALLNVGPGANPPTTAPDPTKGNVAAVWGFVGPLVLSPSQVSSPPITCAVYGQGGVIGVNGYPDPVKDADATGEGVIGFGATSGVHGFATKGIGVAGASKSGAGVSGASDSGFGVFGSSNGNDGVHGESQSSQHAGVSGVNTAGGFGVWASGKTAGHFEGDVEVTGTLTAKVDIVLGSDCAEDFDIAPSQGIGPGTVMVLTEHGALEPSHNAYDKKVAGVISGAGDYAPGLILGRRDSSEQRMPLALVGKVYCKADARYGPIAVGDMLTTSPTHGHAMRAADPLQAFGAVIGKALRPLDEGEGLIPILIALQ